MTALTAARHRRTGRVHIVRRDEAGLVTVCGRWARRDHYRTVDGSYTQADCALCWTHLSSRTETERGTR